CAVAGASAIGGVMTERMSKEGYPVPFSAAVNITSATAGMVIPPSNILIVCSLASGGVSIAALFLAGYLPGILIGLALMVVAGIYAKKHNFPRGEKVSVSTFFKSFFDALPSLFLLFVVMGGIIAGVFTATEASAVAVVYTLVLSMIIYKEIKIKDIPGILLSTVGTTAIVMLLIGTSMGMSW